MTYFHIGDLITEKYKLKSKQEYEALFKESGTLLNRYKRYIKSNLGTKSAFPKLQTLIETNKFQSLDQIDKKHILPKKPSRTIENDYLSKKRFEAMKIKASYLNGENLVDKDGFRKLYIETEELFDNLPISLISDDSFQIIQDLDIKWWYELKKNNWKFLANHKYKNAKVLIPESDNSYPFTFVLKFDNNEIRNKFRFNLIENRIYPAILWSVPDSLDEKYSDFTDTMLSIHCDARYNLDDIKELYSKIISAIEFE